MQLRRSLLITFLSSNASTIVQFCVTVALARLLTPADIGVFSITVVFINLIAVFRDFGVAPYLIREEHLTPAKIRSALGLLLTTSWILAVVLLLISGPVARYFDAPGVADVMRVLTISFLLVPYASVLSSLLMRSMQAGRNAVVNIASTLVYASTSLALAWMGFGYLALAWANVANLLANILLLYLVRPAGTPLVPAFRGWHGLMRFGGGAVAGNLLTVGHASLPDLLLGKTLGPHGVGVYSRANGLVGLFQQAVGPAISYNALPFIARSHHTRVPLLPILTRATHYLTGLAWPAYIGIGLFAEPTIRLLYGAAWVEAAPLVPLICLAAAARVGYSLSQPALLAVNKPYIAAVSVGGNLLARIGILLLVGIEDLWTFALALCVADVLSLPLTAWLMSRYLGYTLRASVDAHWASFRVGIVCLAAGWMVRVAVPESWPAFAVLTAAVVAIASGWIAGVVWTRHPLTEELATWRSARSPAAASGEVPRSSSPS